MKFIGRYVRPFVGMMLLGLLIKTVGTLIELALPYILSYILDEVVPHDGRLARIVMWGGAMVGCAMIAWVCNVQANRMASKVSRDCTERIRHDLFYRTMTLSATQMDRFTVPSLESRMTTDTYNVQSFIGRVQRMGVRAPLMLMGGVIVTLIMDRALALVMLAILPVLFGVVLAVSRFGVRLYARVQTAVDGMVRVVREDAQGIRVIKALSTVPQEHRRYDAVNRTLVRSDKKAALIMGTVNPVMNLLMNLGITFVVLIGAQRVMHQQTEPGKIVAFTQYFTMISTAALSVTRIFMMYTKSAASAARIQQVVDTPPDMTVLPDTGARVPAFIRFDHVSFSYETSRDTLRDVSFSLPRGGSLGIIGATGSGKTTLLNLLLRRYDAAAGTVYLDGRDVRTIPEAKLHGFFGIAMQNDFLYADTIEENIRFGRALTHEQIVHAARLAQADEFIRAFSEGYDHLLSPKATNISGGQKQRLLIARALAADPAVLVLDDSSSALDYKTDAALRAAIAQERAHTTQIIVAQRVSSVMRCDRILVLEDGAVIGDGTHEQLMCRCPVYREISESQMGGAILD